MHEALAEGSDAAAPFTHPDFEVRFMASHPLGGSSHGAGDAIMAMTEWEKSFEDFRGDAEEFIDAGADHVVVAFRERGRPRGGSVELDQLFGILYTLRDGKVARMEWFDNPDEALAAAGVQD
jgi:ketosteroid isomerase-like protein